MSGGNDFFIFKFTYIYKQKVFKKNYTSPNVCVRCIAGGFTLNGTKFHLSDNILLKITPIICHYSSSDSFVVFTLNKDTFKLLQESGLNNNLSLNTNYIEFVRFLPVGQIDETEFFKLIEDYQTSYGAVN
jgi:hypothetical protein